MPVPPPQLVAADGQSAVGKTLDIPADGLSLTLVVQAVAPARLELTQAELTLTSPAGTTDLTGGAAGLTVTTNLGPLSANWASEQDATKGGVTWLTADWGARRPLVALKVNPTTIPADATQAKQARLRISDGGAGFPPQPVDTIPLGQERTLPEVVASRLMAEVVAPGPNGVLVASKDFLNGLVVKLGSQPEDLSVSVGTQPPVFERPGRLVAGQQARVVDGLREALQKEVPADGKGASIPLVIRDSLRGRVTVSAASFSALAVYSALDGALTSLPLAWGGEAVGQVTVGTGTTLADLRFTLVPELTPERFLVEGRPEQVTPYAQLCDSTHAGAQGFPGLGAAALAGVDVLLRPLSERVVGTLALYPDVHGRPGNVPYTGAQVPFTLTVSGPKPWAPRIVPVQLPKPLRLGERWWLVLTVTEGAALWPLSTALPVLSGDVGPMLRQLAGGAWSPWEGPPDRVWALARLRVASQAPPPAFRVKLRRGTASQLVLPDASGRVVATSAVLTALGTTGPAVEVALSSAGTPVTGTLRLDGLRVAVR